MQGPTQRPVRLEPVQGDLGVGRDRAVGVGDVVAAASVPAALAATSAGGGPGVEHGRDRQRQLGSLRRRRRRRCECDLLIAFVQGCQSKLSFTRLTSRPNELCTGPQQLV